MSAMATVTVHRAGDLARPVEPCTIVIGEPVEVLLGRTPTMEEARLVYDAEAVRLADALVNHLPQGTLDRVLLRLMERKVKSELYRGAMS